MVTGLHGQICRGCRRSAAAVVDQMRAPPPCGPLTSPIGSDGGDWRAGSRRKVRIPCEVTGRGVPRACGESPEWCAGGWRLRARRVRCAAEGATHLPLLDGKLGDGILPGHHRQHHRVNRGPALGAVVLSGRVQRQRGDHNATQHSHAPASLCIAHTFCRLQTRQCSHKQPPGPALDPPSSPPRQRRAQLLLEHCMQRHPGGRENRVRSSWRVRNLPSRQLAPRAGAAVAPEVMPASHSEAAALQPLRPRAAHPRPSLASSDS